MEPGAAIGLVLAYLLGAPLRLVASPPPSFVVVTTDDQSSETLVVMPRTIETLVTRGTVFANAVTSFPLCAPSRVTFLTARYAHNHGVRSNLLPAGGYGSLDHASTLPVALQAKGYYTAHVGKYVNGYGEATPSGRPPGYDDWFGLVDPTTYSMYEYQANDRGTLRWFGSDVADYQTDVLAERAVAAIRAGVDSGRPFFVHVAPLAPHLEIHVTNGVAHITPPRPAVRHAGRFAVSSVPFMPAFNEADVSDKPAFVRMLPLLDDSGIRTTAASYRARLESLLAVDDLVGRVMDELAERGALSRTVVVLTSDNGYLLGEHRLTETKIHHYQPSLRVPLVIRGRGFGRGRRSETPVSNVDLASTVASMAGVRPSRAVDGRRLDRLARRDACGDGVPILLEGFPASLRADEPRSSAIGVLTGRYRYTEYATGEAELYDLEVDPFELENLAAAFDTETAHVRTRLVTLLHELRACAGSTCRPRARLRLRARSRGAGARLRLTGPDRAAVRAVQFRLGRRAWAVTGLPFRVDVRRRGRGAAWARVVLWDGRTIDVPERGHTCEP